MLVTPKSLTDTVDVLILLTTSRGWSLAAEVGQDSQLQTRTGVGVRGDGGKRGHPYLQRSSCVESRTFFLFLLLPWWCGLLLGWLLVLEEELCCPWWPLFWWERDILAWRKNTQKKKICLVSERFSFGIQYSMLQAGNSGEIGLNWCLL